MKKVKQKKEMKKTTFVLLALVVVLVFFFALYRNETREVSPLPQQVETRQSVPRSEVEPIPYPVERGKDKG